MRAWSTSALNGYYRDPEIVFREIGYREVGRAAIAEAGQYIVPHCDPDCCAAFDELRTVHLGPFNTAGLARAWSRRYLSQAGAADDD